MIVGMVPVGAITSSAADGKEPIAYEVCVDGINQVWETRYCTEYTVINEHNKPLLWEDGWYVCEGAFYDCNDGNNRIEVRGDVHLIIKDGEGLTVDDGIEVGYDMSLSIYQQPTAKEMPVIHLNNKGVGDESPLGSRNDKEAGNIYLHGCSIEATTYGSAAAVGGGVGTFDAGNGGNITVYGGALNAVSSRGGAAIGGGGDIAVCGNGGSLTVYGGHVHAVNGDCGAAIGGGGTDSSAIFEGGDGGDVTVYGGNVIGIAKGNGAGIGGGDGGGDGGSFKMYGGEVDVSAWGNGAAIGGGEAGDTFDSDDNVFGLYGGELHATGNIVAFGPGAGGDDEDGIVTVGTDCAWIDRLTNKQFDFAADRKAVLGQKEFWLEDNSSRCPVSYQTVSENRIIENKVCKNYKCAYFDDPTWDGGWYIIDGVGTSVFPVTVTGDVHLILINGCDATIEGGIKITKGSTLTIHQQPQESGVPTGKLTATGKSDPLGIIGYNPTGIYGSLVLCGGDVTAKGISGAVGYAGDLTLYGGNLNAYGGSGSVAIGGGYELWGGDLKFYRGSVTAVAGSGASRAIGVESGSSTDCTIIPGESTTLLDSATGQTLKTSASALTWNDVLSGSTVSFKAVSETAYREYSSDINYFDTKTCLEYTTLSEETANWTDGRYVQNRNNITITDPITVDGEVYLILGNDTTMDLTGGINITEGSSLTVFAQTENSHKGILNISRANGAAVSGGSLTVSGGSINLTGGKESAAIDNSSRMIINGGSVSAKAGSGAVNAVDCPVAVGKQYTLLDSATGDPIRLSGGARSWKDALSGSAVSFDTVVTETYLEYSADGKTCQQKEIIDYKYIDGTFNTLNTGYYLASGILELDSALTVSGNAKIILANNCKLTVNGGICVNEGNSLTVFAQSEGDKAGKLTANGKDRCAGIGGRMGYMSGNITIHGGNITANGGNYVTSIGGGAGIGGGNDGDSSPVVIYGGNITANGGTFSAGIGGGYGGWCGDVTIYGGTVKAVGGCNDFNNGGAGIGGGATNSNNWFSGGCDNVTVYGGKVEATGGRGAAGIGGGYRGSTFASFTIYGGTVEATGGKFATGLGNGVECEDSEEGTVNICGGTLTARAGSSYSRVIGYSDGATQDGSVNIEDDAILINNATGAPLTCNPRQSWLQTFNATADNSYGNYVLSVSVLGNMEELAPTCTENGHKAYYHAPHSDIYYEDADCKIEIGDLAALLLWFEDENGGLIPMSGHKDENKDGFCDVCHTNVCEHNHCNNSYNWNNDYTECAATRHCNDCGEDIPTEYAVNISFTVDHTGENCLDMGYGHYTAIFADNRQCNSKTIETEAGPHTGTTSIVYEWMPNKMVCKAKKVCDDCNTILQEETTVRIFFYEVAPGADCLTKGKGYYQAEFNTLGSPKTESIFDSAKYGPHNYVDGECTVCHTAQPLDDAKTDAKAAIDVAAGDNSDLSVLIHVTGAKVLIDIANSVTEVVDIRNRCIADLKKLTSSVHVHTYSDKWNCNEINHWHDATCGHTELTKDLGKHTFDKDGNCTVCGAKILEVKYIDRTWNNTDKQVVSVEVAEPVKALVITENTATLAGGWYAVSGNVENANRIVVKGTAENPTNIVLLDDAKLDATAGIDVAEGNVLNIYTQKNDTGEIVAYAGSESKKPAIGDGNGKNGGKITVNGGLVTAAATLGAGIDGTVTVNGGNVTATATDGAGIDGDTLSVYAGVVTATSTNSVGINSTVSLSEKTGVYDITESRQGVLVEGDINEALKSLKKVSVKENTHSVTPTADDTCEYCGRIHTFCLDTLICLMIRISNLLSGVFNIVVF